MHKPFCASLPCQRSVSALRHWTNIREASHLRRSAQVCRQLRYPQYFRIVGFLISNDFPLHWALRLKRNMQAVSYRQRKHHSGPVASASAAAAGAGGAAVSLWNQMLRTTTVCTVEAELTKTVTQSVM